MYFKLYDWSRKFYSVLNLSKTKTMNLDKCYFRHMKTEDKVYVSFLLQAKGSVRQFNLVRNSVESLECLIPRIQTNVRKFISGKKKKGVPQEQIDVQVHIFDDKENPIPKTSTCIDLFSWPTPVRLKVHESLFTAVFNSPWIVNVDLPLSILAGFAVYPEYFETHYTDCKKSTFNWYTGVTINERGSVISDIHIKWELVGTGFTYTPTSQDIGKKIKLECIPANETTTGPTVEVISKNMIEAGPGACPFEIRHMFTTSKLKGKSFRCVSYNILADLYCDSDFTRTSLHPYCPPYALSIDYRKQLILKELIGYNADIMCLQEVDRKIFEHCLTPILSNEGLDGRFYKKGKEVAEGLACFFRKDRFSVLEDFQIVLATAVRTEPYLEKIWAAIKTNTVLLERVLDRSTVASATILKSTDNPNEIIIVGNTHLYFHPDSDHIRLIQGGICIEWLRNLRIKLKEKYPENRISLILCGDFNSVPSCGIYQLYTTGKASNTLVDWKSNEAESINNLSLEQDILLGSACGTPPYTNFTAGFADCLDYIFYDTACLDVEQVVPFPSLEELQAHTALPSIVFPSDHISLISDLRFK